MDTGSEGDSVGVSVRAGVAEAIVGVLAGEVAM